MVERRPVKALVAGSSPAPGARLVLVLFNYQLLVKLSLSFLQILPHHPFHWTAMDKNVIESETVYD